MCPQAFASESQTFFLQVFVIQFNFSSLSTAKFLFHNLFCLLLFLQVRVCARVCPLSKLLPTCVNELAPRSTSVTTLGAVSVNIFRTAKSRCLRRSPRRSGFFLFLADGVSRLRSNVQGKPRVVLCENACWPKHGGSWCRCESTRERSVRLANTDQNVMSSVVERLASDVSQSERCKLSSDKC